MQNQTLEFTLMSNNLKNDGRYMARIIHQKTITYENLLLDMENNTALRKEDIRLANTHLLDAVVENLIRGLKVETPLGVFKMSIKGSFDSISDDFRPGAETNNHELKVRLKVSDELEKRVIEGISTEKVLENNLKYPKIFGFENLNSPGNESFSPSNIISISGINLKIDAEMEDEGVFWKDSQGAVTKASVITHNTSTLLQFQIPELEAGAYSLYVSTRIGNHLLRTTEYEEPVAIVQ